MAVDDGIDVVASKDNKYFHIQVKTSNPTNNVIYQFLIKKDRFIAKNSFQTFYILVARKHETFGHYNDFLILPSSEIAQYIASGIIKDAPNLSLKIERKQKNQYTLNGKQDVSNSANNFGLLS